MTLEIKKLEHQGVISKSVHEDNEVISNIFFVGKRKMVLP